MDNDIETILDGLNYLKEQNRILDFRIENNDSNNSIDVYVVPYKTIKHINCTINIPNKNENNH